MSREQIQERLLRLPDILGNPRANPPQPPLVPVSKATWWAGVASGRFPKPVRLARRVTAWRYTDILRLIQGGTMFTPSTTPDQRESATLPGPTRGAEQSVRPSDQPARRSCRGA